MPFDQLFRIRGGVDDYSHPLLNHMQEIEVPIGEIGFPAEDIDS
jgi:hypothetical protein